MKWARLTILEAKSIEDILVDFVNGDYIEERPVLDAINLIRASRSNAIEETLPLTETT